MSTQPEQPKRQKGITGLGIPAGLFIGLGVGLIIDNITAGALLGIGGGFLIMIFLRLKVGEW